MLVEIVSDICKSKYEMEEEKVFELMKHAYKMSQKTEEENDNEGKQFDDSNVGFLYVKCKKCGKIKGFNTKVHLKYYRCECYGKTELDDLKPMHVNCTCGKTFKYRTNIKDREFVYTCINCEMPVIMKLNKRETAYVTDNTEETTKRIISGRISPNKGRYKCKK